MTAAAFGASTLTASAPARLAWYQRVFFPALAFAFAWSLASLPLDAFLDRENYVFYANYSDIILERYKAGGLLTFLANEPLWLYINIYLSYFLYDEQILRVLIFAPAAAVSWLLLRKNPSHAIWIIMLLLAPQVIKNHIIHLRQGVAIAIFMVGYFSNQKWLRYSSMAAAAFVHSSFFFILTIYFAVWVSGRLRLPPQARAITLIAFFALIGGMISLIAGTAGARQAIEYAFTSIDITGLGFLFWASIFIMFATAGRTFLDENMLGFSVLAFYLVVYFVTPLSGRIFESGLFLVFTAGLALPKFRRYIFLAAFLLFSLVQYFTALDDPWLGWGTVW